MKSPALGSHLLGHGLRQLLGSLRVHLVPRHRGGSGGRRRRGSLRVGSGRTRLLKEAADKKGFDANCNFLQRTLTPDKHSSLQALHGN